MKIIFGWNSFKLKSYKPSELNLEGDNQDQLRVEYRQKYFHFFWIPFFGIGKVWVVRKGDNLYEPPAPLLHHLSRQKLPAKTPWYTYAGPLLIMAGFIIYAINDKAERYNSNKRSRRYFSERAASMLTQIDAPTLNDFLQLEGISGSKYCYYKVSAFNEDSIQIRGTQKKGFASSVVTVSSMFMDEQLLLPPVWCAKADLKKTICTDYNESSFKGSSVKGLGMVKLREAYRLDKPSFSLKNAFFADGKAELIFQNSGAATTIRSIENGNKNFAASLKVPLSVHQGDTMRVLVTYTGISPVYDFRLTCTDLYNNQLILHGRGHDTYCYF